MTKHAFELGPVQQTLLIPLFARAELSRKGPRLLHDPKAIEIVEALDYDFSKWRGASSLLGACIRTRIYDGLVKSFLDDHPDGTVIEIGAGLNTRFERLDNGRARWVELDLPDSMALRRRFFSETKRRTMIAASVLDADWFDAVSACPPPYCFVSEAVLIYLPAAEAERALSAIADRFPGAVVITDTTSGRMVDGQKTHDAMRHLPPESWFRWRVDDPKQLERCGLRLERSMTFADAPADLRADLPPLLRFALRWVPQLLRRKVEGYRINRFISSAPRR